MNCRPILIPDLAEPSEREMQMAYAVYSSVKIPATCRCIRRSGRETPPPPAQG
jgi:hypothetical protein